MVVLDHYWFFCTSFSTFVHNNKNIDDCADGSKVGSQKNAVAFIRKKTRAGSDYFKLTIKLSTIELLVTSGFFGDVNSYSIEAFFGSSIANLPDKIVERFDIPFSKDIFIPRIIRPFTRDTRLLNQYMKKHSVISWMFVSLKFKNKGYVPFHPLSLKTENKVQAAASLLLNTFARNIFHKEKISVAVHDTKNYKIN